MPLYIRYVCRPGLPATGTLHCLDVNGRATHAAIAAFLNYHGHDTAFLSLIGILCNNQDERLTKLEGKVCNSISPLRGVTGLPPDTSEHTRLNHSQTDTRFTFPGGMEGLVDLGDWLHTETIYPQTDGHTYKY